MENKRNNRNNANGNGNRKGRTVERPERKKRVSIDRDLEVIVVSNTNNRIFYENPRMSITLDLHQKNDEEYLTVGDLRTILNSHRGLLEGFELLVTEVVGNENTLEEVLLFLGLDKKYAEYFALNRKDVNEDVSDVEDIKNFIINAPVPVFEKQMKIMNKNLRARIIENSVVLFKLKQFSDYNKMEIIESYVNDELFSDAKETEIDENIYM